jgi:hypothetical protein
MAEQETPRVVRALRDLERKAKEMAERPLSSPESEVKRLRGLIRAILSKGPYVFDEHDVVTRDGKSVVMGRCFWCAARVEGEGAEANHAPTCAWLALEVEAEEK